jgi:hypothetical protein
MPQMVPAFKASPSVPHSHIATDEPFDAVLVALGLELMHIVSRQIGQDR